MLFIFSHRHIYIYMYICVVIKDSGEGSCLFLHLICGINKNENKKNASSSKLSTNGYELVLFLYRFVVQLVQELSKFHNICVFYFTQVHIFYNTIIVYV